jgi:RimJ/RimL family protein N-acetyltransferase
LDAELPDPDAHLDFADGQLNDPVVAPWHDGPRPRERVLSMLRAQAEQAAETGFTLWWWRERESGELVGYTGLNRDEVDGEPAVEIGWSITPSRWGEGFATEGARASLAWGFERCGLTEIVAFALPENVRSRRVMEKIGMRFEREFERQGLVHVLYRIRGG